MESSEQTLKSSLQQYETQLSQTEAALAACTDEITKLDLYALQEDLLQLISLTKENLSTLSEIVENDDNKNIESVDSDDESNYSDESVNVSETQDQYGLLNLPGSKCQAPYIYKNGNDAISYHNALVLSVENYTENTPFEDIMVKVMFVNPICRQMLPCSYYLNGTCKFESDKCHFSHGELVRFAHLKEFRKPNFKLIKEASVVLAKTEDGLWQRAFIVNVISEENKCTVKFESRSKGELVLDLHDILPLEEEISDSSNESCEDNTEVAERVSFNKNCESNNFDDLVDRSLLTAPASQALGQWEKHTTSVGSRIMERMGYVHGTGLGKNADGRVEPVSAVVLPAGKSLDHCMALREAAGGDPNLFNVEKLQKKLQQKETRLKSQLQHCEKRRNQKNVFSFINKALSIADSSPVEKPSEISLKDSSERVLNIEKCKVDESIRKKEKSITSLYLTLSRLPNGSKLYMDVQRKLTNAQKELELLQTKESNISREKSYRDAMKQMTAF